MSSKKARKIGSTRGQVKGYKKNTGRYAIRNTHKSRVTKGHKLKGTGNRIQNVKTNKYYSVKQRRTKADVYQSNSPDITRKRGKKYKR